MLFAFSRHRFSLLGKHVLSPRLTPSLHHTHSPATDLQRLLNLEIPSEKKNPLQHDAFRSKTSLLFLLSFPLVFVRDPSLPDARRCAAVSATSWGDYSADCSARYSPGHVQLQQPQPQWAIDESHLLVQVQLPGLPWRPDPAASRSFGRHVPDPARCARHVSRRRKAAADTQVALHPSR